MAALRQIEEKRKELIDPLEDQRKELLSLVEESFDRLYRGNAAITAYLNSIRKIQEMREETLKALNLADLQVKINEQLQNVSKYADEGLEAIKEADGIVDTVGSWLK
jgi:cytochrome b involved in lipid metabolism